MAIPLILALGGTVVRAVAPRVVQQLMRQGAKRATTQQIKKAGGEKGMSTITSVKQAKNLKPTRPSLKPSTKIVKPKSGVTSQQRSALSDMGGAGRSVVPKKPTTPAARKPSTTPTTRKPSALTTPRTSSVAAPKARPTRPSMRNITPTKRALPKAPPSRPVSNAQRLGAMGKTAAALGGAASMLPSKKEGPKSSVASPAPRPKISPKKKTPMTEGNTVAGAKGPPSAAKYRPGKGGQVMPKKFDGGYNSKTQKLVNITVDGKKSTYEIPKGMTTKQAKNLLTSTTKKKAGGTPGKYKGFSKLPEKVQKKMSPKLASKYKKGGSITGVGNAYLKTDNTSKVARQVKGFGAARKPKK